MKPSLLIKALHTMAGSVMDLHVSVYTVVLHFLREYATFYLFIFLTFHNEIKRLCLRYFTKQ